MHQSETCIEKREPFWLSKRAIEVNRASAGRQFWAASNKKCDFSQKIFLTKHI
jgi:hypothetical protein